MSKTEKNEDIILSVSGLSKYFGGITALSDFDLQVKRGELRVLIGPNGAGKTTVFKTIMGIYPPSAGEVLYKGVNITGKRSHIIAKMGLAIKMQIPGVYQELTMRENMRIAGQKLIPAKELSSEIERLLKLVKLDTLGDPYVKNMSHGQQQWLEMAMALASKPELLLLDEPAAGLGPEETEFTAQFVRELNRNGMTILVIEHDMNFVRSIARQVTVLHQGQKFADGSLAEILSNQAVQDIYLGRESAKQ